MRATMNLRHRVVHVLMAQHEMTYQDAYRLTYLHDDVMLSGKTEGAPDRVIAADLVYAARRILQP